MNDIYKNHFDILLQYGKELATNANLTKVEHKYLTYLAITGITILSKDDIKGAEAFIKMHNASLLVAKELLIRKNNNIVISELAEKFTKSVLQFGIHVLCDL